MLLPGRKFLLNTCLAYFSALKMKAICFSEMLLKFYWATQHYIPEDKTLYVHSCENLKSKTISFISDIH
jgi:hypothetical protein